MNPTNGQLVKNKKTTKTIFHLRKQKKQNKETKKKHLNIAPYFRQRPLLFELQNTEFSFQFNSLMILYIKENLVNLRKKEIQLVSEIRMNFKQCKNHATS